MYKGPYYTNDSSIQSIEGVFYIMYCYFSVATEFLVNVRTVFRFLTVKVLLILQTHGIYLRVTETVTVPLRSLWFKSLSDAASARERCISYHHTWLSILKQNATRRQSTSNFFKEYLASFFLLLNLKNKRDTNYSLSNLWNFCL